MSKSLNNAIALGASPDEITKAVNRMYSDPGHLRMADPGKVEGNVVFSFLDAFDPDVAAPDELKAHDRQGGLAGSIPIRRLNERLQAPIREPRMQFGAERARETASRTVAEVKAALGLDYFG